MITKKIIKPITKRGVVRNGGRDYTFTNPLVESNGEVSLPMLTNQSIKLVPEPTWNGFVDCYKLEFEQTGLRLKSYLNNEALPHVFFKAGYWSRDKEKPYIEFGSNPTIRIFTKLNKAYYFGDMYEDDCIVNKKYVDDKVRDIDLTQVNNEINTIKQQQTQQDNNITNNTQLIQDNTNKINSLESANNLQNQQIETNKNLVNEVITNLRDTTFINYKGVWNQGTNAKVGEVYSFNNELYLCKVETTNEPTNTNDWDMISAMEVSLDNYYTKLETNQKLGEYVLNTTYQKNKEELERQISSKVTIGDYYRDKMKLATKEEVKQVSDSIVPKINEFHNQFISPSITSLRKYITDNKVAINANVEEINKLKEKDTQLESKITNIETINTTQTQELGDIKNQLQQLINDQANDMSYVGEINDNQTYKNGDYGFKANEYWYIYDNGIWKKINQQISVDLNNYYNKQEINNLLTNKVDNNVYVQDKQNITNRLTNIEAKNTQQDSLINQKLDITTFENEKNNFATNQEITNINNQIANNLQQAKDYTNTQINQRTMTFNEINKKGVSSGGLEIDYLGEITQTGYYRSGTFRNEYLDLPKGVNGNGGGLLVHVNFSPDKALQMWYARENSESYYQRHKLTNSITGFTPWTKFVGEEKWEEIPLRFENDGIKADFTKYKKLRYQGWFSINNRIPTFLSIPTYIDIQSDADTVYFPAIMQNEQNNKLFGCIKPKELILRSGYNGTNCGSYNNGGNFKIFGVLK